MSRIATAGGGGEAERADPRDGSLLQTASTRTATGSTTTAASELLEEVASPQNLVRAPPRRARRARAVWTGRA